MTPRLLGLGLLLAALGALCYYAPPGLPLALVAAGLPLAEHFLSGGSRYSVLEDGAGTSLLVLAYAFAAVGSDGATRVVFAAAAPLLVLMYVVFAAGKGGRQRERDTRVAFQTVQGVAF